METLIIVYIAIMLICSHMIVYNVGAVKAYDRLEKELKRIYNISGN